MLLVNVHELDIILADPIVAGVLEHKVDNVWCILRLDCQHVLILGSAKHLGQGAEVDAEGNIAVASEGLEGFGPKQHGDEGNVGVVHGLEGDAAVITVEVAVLDKVLDCIYELNSY